MKIKDVISHFEELSPEKLQENYDNVGLLVGDRDWEVRAMLVSLEITSEVIDEAIEKKCNIIVVHHPLIFKPIHRIDYTHYIGKSIVRLIKHDIALYVVHTNLDNVKHGVNKTIADKLGLVNHSILLPKQNQLKKLVVYILEEHIEPLKQRLFDLGAKSVDVYAVSSASDNTVNCTIDSDSTPKQSKTYRLECIFLSSLEGQITRTLARYYHKDVVYEMYALHNYNDIGSGLLGTLQTPMQAVHFLQHLKKVMDLEVCKHTELLDKPIQKVAVCGGSGSFLIHTAKQRQADIFITSDITYHNFFDADGQIIIVDIGHYESEKYVKYLIRDFLVEKKINFTIFVGVFDTNPIKYFK